MVAVLWRCRWGRLCLGGGSGGVCGAAGVPGVGGPGRCVCPWAAARPLTVRAASFARRVVSKPGQAPPPPTGAAARPSGPSGALHTGGACVAWTSPAWPCRRPRPLQPGSLTPFTPAAQPEFAIELVACGSAGVPGAVGPGRPRDRHTRAYGSEWSISKPARALRTLRRPPHRRRLVADVWLGALTRCPARPRHSPRASQISRVKPVSPLLARARVGLKPASPLLAQAQPQLKPPSPLRARNGRFGCVFRLQR